MGTWKPLIAAVACLLFIVAAEAAAQRCPTGFLSCHSGECIRQAKFCDGQQDCKDSSDESECDSKCHPPEFFRCHNGHCVGHMFVCDGEDECGDGSDERDCGEEKALSPAFNNYCTEDEFRCGDGLCIPAHWKCDSQHDCLDGTDELIGCTDQTMCSDKGFLCANHHCIPQEWHCDGQDDCLDNSDEQRCTTQQSQKSVCSLERDLYECADRSCVELVELCDGVKQCLDGSDEGPACNDSKEQCKSFGCSHRCYPTPAGPICTCPKGFVISKEKYCKDIDECQEYDRCSQVCENVPGSYECKCAPHFELEMNNKSCKAIGPEALLVYALKTEVRALFLTSQVMWPVAKNQGHVAGVAYDGIHMYWTSLENGEEAIVRSKEDGSEKEIVISAGLSLPEDLAIDWLTGNIYFTDGEEKRIGACSTTGKICTVLVIEDVDAPRAIALHISEGYMYWTDWGDHPMVAKAGMDGSMVRPFVDSKIQWPNGLALDIPNRRLYWVDAKLSLVESIKLDGTDRRTILSGVVKHPYALAVFEDYLYWSDFKTSEILSCHKFTGKEQKKIAHSRDNYVYGINIYHPSLHPEIASACDPAPCSDICLLAPNKTYTCACPETKIINEDHHTCREIEKHEGVAIAAGHLMIKLEHSLLGKQEYTSKYLNSIYKIGALAYNSLTGEVFFSDLVKKAIFVMDMTEKLSRPEDFLTSGIGDIVAMDFDHLGNNLYWCDAEHQTVEVMSLVTRKRKVLLRTYGEQTPLAITVVPEEGVMFLAFKNYAGGIRFHIDKLHMDGSGGLTHIVEETLRGPIISLAYDHQMKKIFFSDSGRKTIESTSVDGSDYHRYADLQQTPISITTLGRELFWTSNERTHLHWSNKFTVQSKVKQLSLELLNGEELILATALRSLLSTPNHPCHKENGGCSHLCLVTLNDMICSCPNDLELDKNNKTCITPIRCLKNQFRCGVENKCIPKAERCDGKPDCSAGEDEKDCPKKCLSQEFTCNNGQCIPYSQKCDKTEQCTDGSDEFNCLPEECQEDQFHCLSGECINIALRCDMRSDCRDNSDEDCADATCPPGRFRCKSGSCIPAAWECDRDINCMDGSDEHDECPTTPCHPEDFQCANRRCIDARLKCNGKDDCGDNSDELSCPKETVHEYYCKENEFKCDFDKRTCVPAAARCNGSAECPKGEDELECGCTMHQFECDHNRCIDRAWVCDGMNDCNDQKDEDPALCKQNIDVPSPASCPDFKCKTGECLSLEQVCDGVQECTDGSDEGGKCSTACSSEHPCKEEQVCHPTPGGARCTCKLGYEFPIDSAECQDIDECNLNLCTQTCDNTPGSYACSCTKGYHLRLDRRSCKAEGEAMQVIYVANGNEVRMAPYSLQRVQILHQDTGIRIVGLDVNVPKKIVYWSSGIGGAIFYTTLDSKITRSATNLGRPGELAVDWISGNIYFADEAQSEQIWIKVCNFESKTCAKVLSAEKGIEIDNLVVDPLSGFIFWTEVSFATFDEPHTKIKRADMTGRNGSTIMSALQVVSGLAVDPMRRTLFWVDHKISKVGSVGYHGGDEQILFDQEQVRHPSGLALFEDSIYWISTESGKLMKCRVYGESKTCDWVQLNSYNVEHFTIYQEQRQGPGENYCLDMDCSNLCIRTSTGAKCLCPDGTVVATKEPCDTHGSDLKPEFPDVIPSNDTSGMSAGSIIGILIAILIICCIAYGVYIWGKTGKPMCDPRILFRQHSYHETLDGEAEGEEEIVHMRDPTVPSDEETPQLSSLQPSQRGSIQMSRVRSPSQQSLGQETSFTSETRRLIP